MQLFVFESFWERSRLLQGQLWPNVEGTNSTLFHTIGPALSLVVPFHDGARTIENQPTSANVWQHPAFGFLPDPLEAGAALFVPQDFK